jgi:hypothetical protein
MAGASEGKGHHRKGLREENIPREGLEERGITVLEKPRRKEERSSCSSIPVVPVIPINFETPPFSLITYNYLITN